MATGRDIRGQVVMDATVEVGDAEAKLNAFFDQVFEIKTRIGLPSKPTVQAQLDALTKGLRATIKVDLVLDNGDLAKSVAQVKAAEAGITRVQAAESAKRITDNVRAANRTKNIADKLAADQIRLEEQAASARKIIEADLAADRIRALDSYTDFQRREAIKQTGAERKAADARKLIDKQVQAAAERGEITQTGVVVREEQKRLTAKEAAALKERGLYTKAELNRLLIEERTNARLEILNEQHFNRINAQEQASALRREIINAQLQARLTAQNAAFEQRRQFAAEASQRKLQAQANKPIIQRLLVDANAINSSLADFDRTVTRGLRTSLTAFTVWAAGVEAAVAGAALAAAVSFGKLEGAATRAGAVVASQKQADQYIRTGKVISDFSALTSSAADKIQAKAQEIALATTGFSPTEVIEGTRALLQAGQTLPSALTNIGNAAQFAQVNQQDLSEASDQLAAGLAAAGRGAEYSSKLLDQISFTAQTALGDASEYLEAFANRGASSFRTYGEGIEETLTLLSLLGQTGVKGRTAGTQASIVIRDIAKAAAKSPDAFKKYGIAVKSANTPNVAFNETLLTLSNAIERAQKGNRIAELRKELGFMDRSFGSILQVVPQVNALGQDGLDNFAKGLANSSGQVNKQVTEINKTLPAQFDKVGDAISIALGKIGARFGPELTELFDVFSGKNGLIDQATSSLIGFGDRVGEVIARVTAFVQTRAFRRGVQTFVEAIGVTLEGVNRAFQVFAAAFDDGEKARSTFEAIADSVLGFSRAAAAVLPAVANIIGQILDFLIDNADAFETFAKITLAVYALRKAFSLIINPIGQSFLALQRFLAASQALAAAGTIGPVRRAVLGIAEGLGLVKRQGDAAARSLQTVAAVDILQTNAIGPLGGRLTRGRSAPGSRGTAAIDAAVTGSQLGASRRFGQGLDTSIDAARAGANLETITTTTAGTRALTGAFARATLATAALYTAIPIATGVMEGFSEATREARKDSEELDGAIDALGDAFGFLDRKLGEGAKYFGRSLGEITSGALQTLSDIELFVRTGTTRRMREEERAAERRAAAADKERAAIGRAVEAQRNAAAGINLTRNAYGKLVPKAEGAILATDDFVDKLRKIVPQATAIARALKNKGEKAFRDFALQAIASGDAASDALNRVITSIEATQEILDRTAQLKPGQSVSIFEQGDIFGETFFNNSAIGQQTKRGLAAQARALAKARREAQAKALKIADGPIPGALEEAGSAPDVPQREFVDPDEAIQAAIDRLKPAQRAAQLQSVIARTTARAGEAFTLTRRDTLLLAEAIPTLEKNIDRSRAAVEKLDQALGDLRSTQLAGTQAFSDQAFALDQQIKQLQLNRLDALGVAGTTEESPQVKAIDDQIRALQTQSERLSLTESLQLDPLRRKLEQTFNPVREDTFENITAQFAKLTAEQKAQTDQLTAQETQRERLNAALERSSAAYQRIDDATQRSVEAYNKAQQAAADTASSIGSVASSASSGATAVNSYSDAVEAVPSGAGVVDKSLAKINERITTLAPQFAGAGRRIISFMSSGISLAATGTLYPGLATVMGQINLLVRSSEPVANSSGKALMDGFLAGIKQGFGTPQDVGTVAWYLNVFIPDWIRKNKGPIAYDAQILVPAGNAVMEGFGRGLRDGFSDVKGFIKEVGPSLGEIITADKFNARLAPIMADIAVGKTPDIDAALGDLKPRDIAYGDYTGPLDPTLGFLHRSLSLADTTKMAQQLAKIFETPISSLLRPGAITTSGNPSNHGYGLAADFSNGSNPTPEMDALYAALLPLKGKVFSELLYKTMVGGNHFNHVHAAWLRGAGFDMNSGKLGKPAIVDIPGASPVVDAAINAASQKYGTELALLAAVAKAESAFNPKAGSPAGAQGLFQFIPSTAKGFGINPFDPYQAAEGGARYLNNLLKMFSGRYNLALAGYNAGPNAPGLAQGKIPPYAETQNYVRTVLSYLDAFRKQFGGFRELGGPTLTGKSYVVGERGPEIFTPSRNGTIIPNDQTQQILSGGTTINDNRQINVTTAATDPAVVAEYVDEKTKTKFVGVNSR